MSSNLAELPALKAALPEQLNWLEPEIRVLQRHTAFGKGLERELRPGATRRDRADIPADAAWAHGVSPDGNSEPSETGKSFLLQLNLEDIPGQVRRLEWPAQGMLWVFLEGREVYTHFDARPAATIPWGYNAPARGEGVSWEVGLSLPWATPVTLPKLEPVREAGDAYDLWVQQHYLLSRSRSLVLGGYAFTNQGDHDEDNKDFVLGIEDLYFGDCGEVYVFFNAVRGFYGRADIS